MGVGVIEGRERRRGSRYVGYAFLVCLFTALVAFALWWRWANVIPNLSISSVPLPEQNAYDFWRSASARVAPADATLLRTLFDEASGGAAAQNRPRLSAGERKALLARHGEALREFADGLRYPYVEPFHPAGGDHFSHYSQFRALARVLRLDGLELAAREAPAGAVGRGLDGIHMGVEIPHAAPNIGVLTGASIQREARADVWAHLPRLSAREAREAAARLERICARQVPYWQTLEAEKRFGLQEALAIVRKSGWRSDLNRFGLGTPTGFPRTGGEALIQLRLATMSKSEFVQNYAAHLDHLIAVARGPYPGGTVNFPRSSDAVTERVVAVFDIARFVAAKEESQNGLLLLSLALRAYHADRGRYPATLDELAPKYLARVPSDPFDPKSGFRYQPQGKTYRLYSLGPDLRDNDGIPARSRSPRNRGQLSPAFKIERGSTGDLVPGVSL